MPSSEEMDKKASSFKKCTKCGFVWPERASLLKDPQLRLIGYQANFEGLMEGFFLFTHGCGTTFSIRAGDFRDLYSGPMFTERLIGTEECGGYCLREDDLRPCPARCACAYAREIGQIILKWPKAESVGTQSAR
jgi:hypothetical protein